MPTLDLSITASADDGYWREDAVTFDNSGTLLNSGAAGGAGSDINIFMRFVNVTIPPGATITAAYLTVNMVSGDTGTLHNIYAEDADNPTAVSSAANGNSRVRTTAFTAWDNPRGAGTGVMNSPDIASVIQEIVDRAGWASGNAIQILFDDDGTSAGNSISLESFDNSGTDEPILHIEYAAGGEFVGFGIPAGIA